MLISAWRPTPHPADPFCCSYEYLNLDDAWSERERGPDDRLVANKQRFPSGMKVG